MLPYEFWGDRLANTLCRETDCIVNLASKEYSLGIFRHLPPAVQWISCVFGEKKDDKIIEKGTLCKMARGETVRFLASSRIDSPLSLCTFNRLGFQYAPEYSNDHTLVFLKA